MTPSDGNVAPSPASIVLNGPGGATNSDQSLRLAWPLAAILFVLIYLLPLGVRPLSAPDEARYCEIAREMLQSGDWVVPRLNGLRYFEKPVLGYWAVAVSMRWFGENEFAARLPAALSVGLSALMIGLLARRAGLDRDAANLAPVVFLTSCGVYPAGTFIILDGMFSALITAAITTYYFALTEDERRRKLALLATAGGLCGLACMVKGFVAFVLAIGIILPFAIWTRRAREVLRIAWLPLLAAVAVFLPWGMAIARREPDFWPYFFEVQHVARFLGAFRQHPEAFWFYIPFLLLGTFPWNVFLAAIVAGLRSVGTLNPLVQYLICWAAFPLLFFSASSGKLITYIMPCYAPLAVLMSIGLVAYLRSGRAKLFDAGAVLLTLLGVLGIGFLLFQRFASSLGLKLFGPNEEWKLALAVLVLAVWLALAAWAFRVASVRRKLRLIRIAPITGFALASFIFPVELRGEHFPETALRKHTDRIAPGTVLVADRALVHAVCWYYRHADVYLLDGRAGELEYGLSFADSTHRLLAIDDFLNLVRPSPTRPSVVVIIPTDVRATLLRYVRMLKLDEPFPQPKFEATERDIWIGEF